MDVHGVCWRFDKLNANGVMSGERASSERGWIPLDGFDRQRGPVAQAVSACLMISRAITTRWISLVPS